MKHTPGPWSRSFQLINGAPEPNVHPVANLCWDYDGDCGATGDLPWATAKANGELIVAAPELLQELRSLVDCFWEGRPKQNVRRDFHLMVKVNAASKLLAKIDNSTPTV